MKKIAKIIQRQPFTIPGIIFLVVLYLLMRDVFPSIPYINVLTNDVSGKLAVLWIATLLLIKPSANSLIFFSIIVLILNFVLIMIGVNGEDESFGLIIYTSLLFLVYKFLRHAEN